jgi:hypothetical protein
LAAASGASKTTQSLLRRMTSDKAAELVKQALVDPELFRVLMKETKTPQGMKKALQGFDDYVKMNAWILGALDSEE